MENDMPRSNYYIPVFDSLPGNRKERAFRSAMGWNEFESIGFLAKFWMQVASDAPAGVLAGPDDLKEVLRAAGIRKKRLQPVADLLLGVGLLDRLDDGGYAVHDWDQGAGMFAIKREKERVRKRALRSAKSAGTEKKNRDGEETGGDGRSDGRPGDVPDEKRKGNGEKETSPPTPPPDAGGRDEEIFSPSTYQAVLETYRRAAKATPGRGFAPDGNTRLGARRLAAEIEAGHLTLDGLEKAAMAILADPRKRDWGLRGIAENYGQYLPGTATEKRRAPLVKVTFTCKKCGLVYAMLQKVASLPYLGPKRCDGRDGCGGVMNPVADDEEWKGEVPKG